MSQAQIASPWVGTRLVNVTDYQTGFQSKLQSAQLKEGTQNYPLKALQSDFQFTVQFRGQDELVNFQNFLLASFNVASGAVASRNILRFYWPEMNIDYAGFITEFMMGRKKFETVCKRSYTMKLVRDSIFTVTNDFSNVDSWRDIYGTDVVNNWTTPAGGGPADEVLNGNPPSLNGPSVAF